MKKRITRTNKIFQIIGFLIALFFSTSGHAQSVGCEVKKAICNDKFSGEQPKCFAHKVRCPDPKDSSKSIEGYVPSSAKINYINIDVTAPNGSTKTVQVPLSSGVVDDINDNAVAHSTPVLVYLMQNGHMTHGSRLSLSGVGISADTKFGKEAHEIIKTENMNASYNIVPTAGTLSQAIKSGGTPPKTNWTCRYTTQPIVIDAPCSSSCSAGDRCPATHNKKQLCVGSATCETPNGYYDIKNVFCQASSCPTNVMDCIVDPSVQTYKTEEDLVPHWQGNNIVRTIGGGGGSSSSGGSNATR